MRLKQATYRHIESEIYSYYITLQTIQKLRNDIIFGNNQDIGSFSGIGKKHAVTRDTEDRAMRLVGLRISEMERITNAIRDVYNRIKPEEIKKTIWLKYDLALNWNPPPELKVLVGGETNRFTIPMDKMLTLLNLDRATFFEHCNGFVYGIAQQLGWY